MNEGDLDMGFTGILACIIIALFCLTIYAVIQGVKNKNWRQVIISVIVFIAFIAFIYLSLIHI